MTAHQLMKEDQLVDKAVQILMREMGNVETSRFLALAQSQRIESLQRHQQWQQQLEKEPFFDQVFTETKS